MDTRKYIESGVIEAYALGMLNQEERQEVERMAALYPELRKALLESETTMEQLADRSRIEPPAALREKVLHAALSGEKTHVAATHPAEAKLPTQATIAEKSNYKWLAIAATVLLLLSLGINTLQYRSINRLQDDLGETLIRLATLENENEVMVANYRELSEDLEILRDPASAVFHMKAVEGRSQDLLADVWWNATSEKVYLDVKKLPSVPAGKQYQLWALKDGKPIDMGVFDPLASNQGMTEMGRIDGADAFAVTLEPRGGSANPTLEEMYVYGTATAS